jgi:hypothetical protein
MDALMTLYLDVLQGCIRRYDLEIGVARFIAAHRKQVEPVHWKLRREWGLTC